MKWPSEMLQKVENPNILFRLSFSATLFFSLMNALVYVDIDQGIHQGKIK